MNRSLLFATSGLLLASLALASRAGEPAISWKLLPAAAASVAPAAAKAAQPNAQLAQGKQEFDNACAICHGGGAPDRPGTLSLQVKYAGARPALLEDRTDLTPQLVLYFIRNGVAMMPQFRKTELDDAQAAAIAAYLARKRR
jgi:(+)-pinoresinol hydroxylase